MTGKVIEFAPRSRKPGNDNGTSELVTEIRVYTDGKVTAWWDASLLDTAEQWNWLFCMIAVAQAILLDGKTDVTTGEG